MSGTRASPLAALAGDLAAGVEVTAAHASLRVLDAIGAFVAGSVTSEGGALARLAGGLGTGTGGAVWSRGVLDDVLVRVATVRLTECDDIHARSGMTPGSVAVPVAVSVGAAVNATPREFMRALAAGYEAIARLGLAIGGPRAAQRGIWPTYLGAGFAAAAVTAALLRLDAERVLQALGIALSRAAWVGTVPTGTPIARWLSVGDAARSGCLAALAAAEGFRGELDLKRFSADTGIGLHGAALAAPAAALEETSVKPFPVAKQVLAAVEAAQRLAQQAEYRTIRTIRLFVPEPYLGVIGRSARPDSRLSRISSGSWNLALALAQPEGLLDVERAAPALDTPELARLAQLVEIRTDGDLLTHYPRRWPARVELETEHRALAEFVVDAPGDPGGGEPPEELVEHKWRRLGGGGAVEELHAAAASVATAPGALGRLDNAMRRLTSSQTTA